MTENTGATEAQGAEVPQSQGDTAQAQGAEAQQAEAASATESGAEGVASLRRKLSDFERDNAKYRERLRTFEQAEQERQQASLSELQKAQQKIAELEQLDADRAEKLQSERLRYRVEAGAAKRQFVDPEAAYALLDRSKVEFDDEGHPRNVDALLQQMAKERPWLTGAGHSGWDGAEGGSSQPTAETLEDAIAAEVGKQFTRR
jgi:hypothetical protein